MMNWTSAGLGLAGGLFLGFGAMAWAQGTPPPTPEALQRIERLEQSQNFLEQKQEKMLYDLFWSQQVADVAQVDRVRYTGPPPRRTNNPTAQGAGNPLIITATTFFPKKYLDTPKLPLLVLVHGGVHATFKAAEEVHIVRELLDQGYAIIAPDYRGSTGYGREFYEAIDYGGLETEDVFAGKQWMLERYPNLDPERVGILGWSHGGMITLLNLFDHPRDYKAAYAGVPVTDLVARMGYKGQGYREEFSAPYHLGKTAEENVNEYRKRSPVWQAAKLQTPLLIHGATNDEDVNVLEVEALVNALKAAGKQFEYKIYTNAPGGHFFNRIDTRLARDSRAEIYRFLARHLNPPGMKP